MITGEDLGESKRSTTLQTFTGQGAGGGDVNQWKRVCTNLFSALIRISFVSIKVEQQIMSDKSHNIIFRATIGQEKKVNQNHADVYFEEKTPLSNPGGNDCHRRCNIHKRVQVWH